MDHGTEVMTPMAKRLAELVADAKSRIANLSVDEFAREIGDGALVVDVREPDEHRKGVIAGALSVPRGMLEFTADPDSSDYRPEFSRERRILLYCAAGQRSALAAVSLQTLGYANVAHLEGGLRAWKAAGRPVADSL